MSTFLPFFMILPTTRHLGGLELGQSWGPDTTSDPLISDSDFPVGFYETGVRKRSIFDPGTIFGPFLGWVSVP